MLGSFGGATVRRVIDPGAAVIPEHAHDWPVLSVFVLGGYANTTERGRVHIQGPSAVLYRAGAAHQNDIGPRGFEQIEIEFDPRWLGGSLPDAAVSQWVGGGAARAARALVRLCGSGAGEAAVRQAVTELLSQAETRAPAADWLAQVGRRLRDEPAVGANVLARDLGRHAGWLGTAYAQAVGETLPETAARLRVERAAQLLRETDEAPAQVAAVAGFCDQSHMIRSFRRVLGRLPSAVRAERAWMRAA